MRHYNHASPFLIIQRKNCEILLEAGKFDEAEEVQKAIDRIEAQEQENAVKLRDREYFESVRRLTEKVERELSVFDSKALQEMAQLKQRRQVERTRFINHQRILGLKEEEMTKERPKVVVEKPPGRRTRRINRNAEKERSVQMRTKSSIMATPTTTTTISLPPLRGRNPRRWTATASEA
jgi:hypothetical protein